jgi:iron(III) transport system substrate-binding protein
MRKEFIAITFVALLALPLFALGNSEENQQHELVLYTSVDNYNANKLFKAFTSDTGIVIKSMRLSSTPALERIGLEKDNPQADVWFGAPSFFHKIAVDEALTQPYLSQTYYTLDSSERDPQGYWRCIYKNPLCFIVNVAALERAGLDTPVSWNDLIKPEYKDCIEFPDPTISGTGLIALMGLDSLMGKEGVKNYLVQLNKNIKLYTPDGIQALQDVKAGRCAIGIQFSPTCFKEDNSLAPLSIVFPSEGVPSEQPAVSIIQGSKHLHNAQIFVDWITGEKGQEALESQRTFFYPIVDTIRVQDELPDYNSFTIEPRNVPYYSAHMDELLAMWQGIYLGDENK